MNNEPIPGRTNHEGIFTAKNPFNPYGPKHAAGTDFSEFDWFSKSHPPLPCYSPDNTLVIDKEVSVTGPVLQAYAMTRNGYSVWTIVWPLDGITCSLQEMKDDAVKNEIETRYCYLTAQPTEKAEEKQSVAYPDIESRANKFTELNPDINPWMAYCHGGIDERNKPSEHLVEDYTKKQLFGNSEVLKSEQLDGVKSAQINIGDTSMTKLVDDCVQIVTKNGCVELYPDEIAALFTFTNAKFATEAGGFTKAELQYINWLKDNTAPSNNSSSEMVEENRQLRDTIADLRNQIHELEVDNDNLNNQ